MRKLFTGSSAVVWLAGVLGIFIVACGVSGESDRNETKTPAQSAPGSDRSTDPRFAAHWRDGKAELNGYRIVVNRYGEDRVGEGVMIFVAEPFSITHRVKLDEPSLESADAVEVLKLNLVMDFQTGIYDYNTMTSVFSQTSDFSPLKITFSSAEWCGHVFDELLFHSDKIAETYHSYFEGESSEDILLNPAAGVTEENLFILLRGLGGTVLAPGDEQTVPFLKSAFARRLAHESTAWEEATISRAEDEEELTVPAGSFSAIRYGITTTTGRTGTIWTGADYPHRILKWSWKSGNGRGDYSGELTGTERRAYWNEKAEGDEALRATMGLAVN